MVDIVDIIKAKAVRYLKDTVTGGLKVMMGKYTRQIPTLINMQSSTPISLTGTTAQKTLFVRRIPAARLEPNCRITGRVNMSRNKTGSAAISYGIYLSDYWATGVGQGEQIISTASLAVASNDVRRETFDVVVGADLRHQKFAQNNAASGGMGNLNKVVDSNFNGRVGLSIIVAATLGNAADVFTIEDFEYEVIK